MNCAQHTDTAAVAFCRTCGKPLCESCRRDVVGTVYCEPCLAARMAPPPGASYGTGRAAGAGYVPPPPVRPPENASPGLALFLGCIPGVGAFYNGQFLKGFVHVIVFATLIWLGDHGMNGFAGVMISAWFFYMLFDAYTTAKARRDGMPIPDPLGLNAILEGKEGTFKDRVEQAGERVGARMENVAQNLNREWQKAGGVSPAATAAPMDPGAAPSAASSATPGMDPGANPGGASNPEPQSYGYTGTESAAFTAPPPGYYPPPSEGYVPRRHEHSPIGAVILIGLGVVFLLTNIGWFSFHWISHFWPAILIALGIWLVVKRYGFGSGREY